MDPTVPSTSSGTASTSSGTASTSSGTGSTDNSESKRPVAEPVEATVLPTTPPRAEPVEANAVTIDSDSAKSVAEPVEAKPFTIGDLINELKRYPEDVVVLTDGYEGDYENILQPKLIRVMLIQNQPYYYGQYHISEDVESFEALVIKREVRPFNL